MSNLPEITVVHVTPAESWPCELCEAQPVVAYIVGLDTDDNTTGYCEGCLGGAVLVNLRLVAEVAVADLAYGSPEAVRGDECTCSSGVLGFPTHRAGCALAAPPVARDRAETDACQAGTPGCSTDHQPGTDYPCATW